MCTAGWFEYSEIVPGYETTAFYFPAQKTTIVVMVNTGALGLASGAATTIFQDIAAIMTPRNLSL